MSILDTIMENEDFQNYMTENEKVLEEAGEKIDDFNKVVKSFILSNPKEFLAENLDQTKKNIRVFTEVATAQYAHEVSSMVAEQVNTKKEENLEETNDRFSEYF